MYSVYVMLHGVGVGTSVGVGVGVGAGASDGVGVEVGVGVGIGVGSTTLTVRVAVPTLPAESVALYSIVCVLAILVSISTTAISTPFTKV